MEAPLTGRTRARPTPTYDKVPDWIQAMRGCHPQTPAEILQACRDIAARHGYQIVSQFDTSEKVFFRGHFFVGPGIFMKRHGCLAIGTAYAFATEEVVRRHHGQVAWER